MTYLNEQTTSGASLSVLCLMHIKVAAKASWSCSGVRQR